MLVVVLIVVVEFGVKFPVVARNLVLQNHDIRDVRLQLLLHYIYGISYIH